MNTLCSMFSYGIVVVATPRVRIDRYMTPLLPLRPLQHCIDTHGPSSYSKQGGGQPAETTTPLSSFSQ